MEMTCECPLDFEVRVFFYFMQRTDYRIKAALHMIRALHKAKIILLKSLPFPWELGVGIDTELQIRELGGIQINHYNIGVADQKLINKTDIALLYHFRSPHVGRSMHVRHVSF